MSAPASSGRAVLEGRLASLLGFDDVSEVFDHLISIESNEDLLDYLSQLLGDDGEEVRRFVADAGRFRSGGTVEPDDADGGGGGASAAAAAGPYDDGRDKASRRAKGLVADAAAVNSNTKQRGTDRRGSGGGGAAAQKDKRRRGKAKAAAAKARGADREQGKGGAAATATAVAPTQKADEEKGEGQSGSAARPPETSKEKVSSPIAPPPEAAPAAPSPGGAAEGGGGGDGVAAATAVGSGSIRKGAPPPRGKAKVVCGCYGTVHKPLTNCLHCGRIACRREGYGYCPFCGILIEKVTVGAGGGKFDKALLHKERLLRYDRELARRTVVLDDQADYFNEESSAWLTQEERAEAEERDEERRKEMHDRKKQVLDIAF